jgi:molybdenum cofactor biosynthesis enzyme MoaA
MLSKNRDRELPTFANINLLGKCNVDCFFCLGKDLEKELSLYNQLKTHFSHWKNFGTFLDKCRNSNIDKLYITGQNTDSLLYGHLEDLIWYLHNEGFQVGLRTNGYKAESNLSTINMCNLSVGYSIHSLNPETNYKIMKRRSIPDWKAIIPGTHNPRISIVVNSYNVPELMDLLWYLDQFPNIRYVQMRCISTDTRQEQMKPHIQCYEEFYNSVSRFYPLKEILWNNAEVLQVFGIDVVFWRTVSTSINSYNYFTDGTVSDMYFVVEGYKKYCDKVIS